jgi:hypothetical protein
VLAALLTASVWKVFDARGDRGRAGGHGRARRAPARCGRRRRWAAHVAYGIAGIGYIITATFLPVIARQALPGSPGWTCSGRCSARA